LSNARGWTQEDEKGSESKEKKRERERERRKGGPIVEKKIAEILDRQ